MKRFFAHASVNFLFLFLALFGGTFSIVSTFTLLSRTHFLFWIVLSSAALVAVLRTLPRPALRGWLWFAALLMLAFLLWWNFDRVWLGGQAVFHKISFSYHQILPSVPYYVLPETLTSSEISAGIRWFFGLLVPFWALWAGLLLSPFRRILWPILLSAAALPAVGLMILWEPPLLPALALVLLLALSLLAAPAFRLDPDLGVRRTWVAAVPLGIVLALIVAAVPPADYVRSPKADEWRAAAMEWVNDLGLTLQGGSYAGGGGVTQNFSNAGPLEFDGHTVLTIEGAAPGTMLLRGISFAVYGETSWQVLPQSAYETLITPPELDFPFTLAAQGADGDLAPTTASIRLSADGSGYLYIPYQLDSLPRGLSPSAFSQDSYIPRASSVRGWQLSYYPNLQPDDVTLVMRSAQWETTYRGWVYQNYTSVPARVPAEALQPAELQGLSSSSTTTQGRLNAAQRVAQYLSKTVRYDQQTPVTPKGEDFVTYFLTQSRQGYCLHYASAATLMLRAMGIPTRFVSGYMVNVPYEGAAVTVPDANAHAWVEIYLDGYGWYPVDVTNGFSGSMDTVFEPEASPSPSPSATPTPSPTPSATPSASPTAAPSAVNSPRPTAPDRGGVSLNIPWPVILRVLAAVCAVAGIAWLQRKLRLKRWKRAMTQPAPNQAVLAVYRYLAALNRRGKVPVKPAAEFLAQKAAFSQHILVPDEVRSMQTLAQEAARLARAQRGFWARLLLRYFWALL